MGPTFIKKKIYIYIFPGNGLHHHESSSQKEGHISLVSQCSESNLHAEGCIALDHIAS